MSRLRDRVSSRGSSSRQTGFDFGSTQSADPPSSNLLKRCESTLKRDARCKMCRLHQTTDNVCILGTGSLTAKGVIVGEAPGASEEEGGEPFIGRSGKLLRRLMKEVGIKDSDVYITNAVHCRPPENRTPTKGEIKNCAPWLKYELNQVEPKVVLLLGGTPLLAVTGQTGIKKLRGQPIEKDGVFYLPTFHPAYALRDERVIPTLKADLAKFKAMMDGGGMPKVPGLKWRIIEDEDDLAECLEWIDKQTRLSFDCETSGLYPWKGHIVSLGIGNKKRQWIVLINHYLQSSSPKFVQRCFDEIDEAIQRRRKKIKLIGQNAKFDSLWTQVHYGVQWRADFDTMLAHHSLDENDRHGLDHLAMQFFGALDYDVPLKVKFGLEGTVETHCRYLALDIMYTDMVAEKLEEMFEEEPGVERVFDQIVMPAARMFVDIELDGIHVDYDKFEEVEEYLRDQMHQYELKLSKIMPGVNWGSPKQVADVLFNKLKLTPLEKSKSGKSYSTSESVMKRLAAQHEIPAMLLKYREAKQQLSFFIEGWKPWLHGGRLHPSFKLHGTVTGRLSCENPNLQQVPRDPRIRSLLIAPPGWEFVEADLSQIELRVAAELSNDRELLNCFMTGIDVHWRTMMASLESGSGVDHAKVVRTSSLYLLRQGLPADGTGAEILLSVFRALPAGTKSTEILSACRELGADKAARDWLRKRSAKRGEENKSVLPEKAPPEELLRALRKYVVAATPSPRRSNQERFDLEPSDAMQILSHLHPSDAEDLDPDWKEQRKKAKAVGFGFLYGMWFRKFVEYARDNYGVAVTEKQAERLRERFFELYSSLSKWHQRQRSFARQNGYVKSLFGRKRRLPRAMDHEDTPERGSAWRQAINSPVQSFASDLNLAACLDLTNRHNRSYFKVCGTVHDAILMIVRVDKLREVVDDVLETMAHPPLMDEFGIKLRVPLEADVKIGPWSKGVSPKKYFAKEA